MKVLIVLFCFLIVIFLSAFSVLRTSAESLQSQEAVTEMAYFKPDSFKEEEPSHDSAAVIIHEMIDEMDPKSILTYIEEQCRIVGVNYLFALSVLREENSAFFRHLEENSQKNSAFVAQNNLNRNGSSDLGLWQLNDNYLWADYVPNYWHNKVDFDWRDPYHSTYIAIRHIKWIYNVIEDFNIEKGIYQSINTLYWKTAMAYNAGLNAVKSGSLPANALDYASRVLERVY